MNDFVLLKNLSINNYVIVGNVIEKLDCGFFKKCIIAADDSNFKDEFIIGKGVPLDNYSLQMIGFSNYNPDDNIYELDNHDYKLSYNKSSNLLTIKKENEVIFKYTINYLHEFQNIINIFNIKIEIIM